MVCLTVASPEAPWLRSERMTSVLFHETAGIGKKTNRRMGKTEKV
jgi:hypothetical protein